VLPQAMRAILPALGNNAISLLKGTSLASVIAVNELTLRSQQIVAQNFKFFPVFAAAGMMYLTVTTLIAGVQLVLERRVNPDVQRGRQPFGESAPGRFFGFRLSLPKPTSSMAAPVARGSIPVASGINLVDLVGSQDSRAASDVALGFVSCQNVWKAYGHRSILQGVDLTVSRGEVVTVMG